VTEHPEAPRIAYGDRRADSRAPDPIVRNTSPIPGWRRPDRSNEHRRILLLATCISVLFGSIYVISLAVRTIKEWLIVQPSYQVPFDEIKLVPPPPEWYRGDARAFLESVRERAGISRPIPILEMTAEQVKVMFVQSPWVERVDRVIYPPHGLRIELQYREPVALITIPGNGAYLLDRSATILPRSDVDPDRLKQPGRLVHIQGDGLAAPSDPQPGATWKPKAGIADITSEGNLRIRSAAGLAGFLVKKMRATEAPLLPALEISHINPMDLSGRGLFVWNGDKTWILWGDAPGEEPPGSLDAEEKWAFLRVWGERTLNRHLPTSEDYWEFSKVGLVRHAELNPSSRPDPR
jgi:hypothetical protein